MKRGFSKGGCRKGVSAVAEKAEVDGFSRKGVTEEGVRTSGGRGGARANGGRG